MNNFKCVKCDIEFFVAQYTISFKEGNTVYKYKATGKLIECLNCKSNEIEAINKEGDFSSLEIGKYTRLSIEQRQESLKERSHRHFKEKVEERQHAINNSATLGTLGD